MADSDKVEGMRFKKNCEREQPKTTDTVRVKERIRRL